MQRHRTVTSALLLAFLLGGCVVTIDARTRGLIGATARIAVPAEDISYLARVDTGAHSSSIHAFDIVVEGGSRNMNEDVGKPLRFRSVNEAGVEREFATVVASVARVTNAQGTELRYQVPMLLRRGAFERRVDVTLRDRSQMSYKLLIGRDWLSDAFVVDVYEDAQPPRRAARGSHR